MSKEAYKNLLHNPDVWRTNGSGVYTQNLINGFKNRIDHYPTWYSCRSRNLEYALRNVVSKYNYYAQGGSTSTGARHLIPLCEYFLNQEIEFKTYFLNIGSTTGETLSFTDLKYELESQTRLTAGQARTHIHLVAVAKGKTYVRNVLDKHPDLNRIKGIETLGIENTQHFLRVYKDLLGQPGDVTIFSDQMTEDLLHLIVLQIPNLFNINPIAGDNLTETLDTRNKQIGALRDIFTFLFNTFMQPDTNNNVTLVSQLTELYRKFSDLFDFTSENAKSFLGSLAKARLQKADKYYTSIINSAITSIKSLEEQLASKYREKHDALLILNSINKEGAEDISEFEKHLKNNKAIEILEANAEEIKIRITAPLQYYTKSDFEMYEKNPSSYVNREFLDFQRDLLHEIFVTQRYKLLLQAIVKLKIQTDSYSSEILSCNAVSNNDLEGYTQFPNPHLYHHNCWSAAKSEINKHISKGDYSLAIMQMISAVQSINVAEHTSFINGLLYDIKQRDRFKKLITLVKKDGTKLSWYDAEKELICQNTPEDTVTPTPEKPKYTQTVISEEPPEPENETNFTNNPTEADEAALNEYHRTVDDEYIPENNEEEVLPF
jgi:hypothetical protein